MASNKRTIYLGLDYSQFSGGITEINRKMGLLDAEFKLAQEQAKNYGTETDKLGIKQEYLTQKIELQKKKVEEAEKAYNAIMSTQGASQKEIDALDKKLLQERTSLEKLNGELKEEEDKTNKANKATKSFGDEIRDAASLIGMDGSPAVEALAKKFDGVSASVGNAIVAIGAMGKKLFDWSKESAQWADDLLTLSQRTGIATDELQKLSYASELIDVDVETMTGSMEKLVRSMNSARDGSGQASEAFRKLRIRTTDTHGQLRDVNEVFYEIIDSLGKVQNETERDAAAMEIFGKSARDLNPLIKAGSKNLKDFGQEAEDMGKIISEEGLQDMGNLSDAMYRFDTTLDAMKRNLALAVVPLLTKLFDAVASIPVPVLTTIAVIASLVMGLTSIVNAIKQLAVVAAIVQSFFGAFSAGGAKTTAIILGVVAALIALGIVIAAIMGRTSDIDQTLEKATNATEKMTATVNNAGAQSKTTARNASGTRNFRGGKTWVGEEGPELVTLPGGSRIEPATNNTRTEYNTFYVTIDAKNVSDFNKVVELARNQRMAERRT